MFSARSFGFLNIPPTAPAHAPVLDQVDAARVVEDRAEGEVAGRQHDQPDEPLESASAKSSVFTISMKIRSTFT